MSGRVRCRWCDETVDPTWRHDCVGIPRTMLARAWRVAKLDDSWKRLAACRGEDPGLFYPETFDPRSVRPVVARFCDRCAVRRACLEWALAVPEPDGIWGGTTPAQRTRLARDMLAV